jgi:hypothetical protein
MTCETLEHAADALVEPAGEHLVVYLPDPESLHLLDAPARLVWELADGRSCAEVCDVLVARFPGTPSVPDEAMDTLRGLLDRGLLTASPPR